MNPSALYRLVPRDVACAAAVLARAFAEYPTFVHLFPDAGSRPRQLDHVMRFFVRCGMLRGEVLAPSSALEGISIWYRSREASAGMRVALRAGALRLPFQLGWRAFNRFKRLGDAKRRHRAEHMPDNCDFLDLIGIDPQHSGKGLATRLLEAKLAGLDREGRSAYLETSNPRNLDYYARFGFAFSSSYRFEGLESLCMLRRPSCATGANPGSGRRI